MLERHCRLRNISVEDLAKITGLEKALITRILEGQSEDVEFNVLRCISIKLGFSNQMYYNRIKLMLALKCKTGRALAEYLQLSEQTISKWVTNAKQPRIDQLYAISDFLNVDPCELLE